MSLVWGFGDVLGGDEIDEFCNENLSNYKEYDELWNYITKISTLENENAILKNENKILKEGKTNVFAELNDETAKSNEILLNEVEDLKQALAEQKQYTAFKCDEHKKIVDELEQSNKWLEDCKSELSEHLGKANTKVAELKKKIQMMEKMVNEIDKTMCLSNMRECEIYDIQEIFRKNGFKRNFVNMWGIAND